ncbi:glutamate-5-semialdehyde dehydrogenase [Myxococcota bacterium]|nr:glutamate-5-semialdehyde dehydrogenase [Myxococcota bacterium]
MDKLKTEILDLAKSAQRASLRVAELGSGEKDAWIKNTCTLLQERQEIIFEANRADLEMADKKNVTGPIRARLDLSGSRWDDMILGLEQIAELEDPVGQVTRMWVRPNGLKVGRMRIPLGVIGIIYESRPNVTIDAAALCVKAGNACILRGGSDAINTNLALGEVLRDATTRTEIPREAISVISMTDRSAIDHLLRASSFVDLVIPRGGPELIRHVTENSSVPILRHDAGICHMFIDKSAQFEMASSLILDSKLRQVSVCNGLETLLVHRDTKDDLLPKILKILLKSGVEIRGCPEICRILPGAIPAKESDWTTEYLDTILSVKVVNGLEEAIEHIRNYGSNHTEVIVTESIKTAEDFLDRVNSSTVGVNCSTAFSDGFRLGLGAEIGISTSKLHAYGPMGLEGLTTEKFILRGEGQIRE